jgi:TetR/AcrR family transcriptional regulator, transcriptional repressor for nem operon
MRYPKDHKDASRQRLVQRSGSHAKQHGFSASGMAALAAGAGVTTGALYKHFDGKADLFAAVIAAELARTAQMYSGVNATDRAGAAQLLAGYLSLQHVRHPAQGCPLPSLTPEIARADAATQAAYQAGLLDIHKQVLRLTPSPAHAWALMAQNIGAVMLARALPDPALQQEVLAAARLAGEQLLAHPP